MTKFKSLGLSGFAAAAAISFGLGSAPQTAAAQPQYLGEIFPVAFTFCPRNTANLDGQLLPISQNSALFSLLGTNFGGDGRTTFALPDMRGRAAFSVGSGPGLSTYRVGQRGGTTSVTVNVSQLATHTHRMAGKNADGDKGSPASDLLASASDGAKVYHNGPADVLMDPNMIVSTGGGQPLQIANPYTVIRYCINLTGVYPSRS